MLIRRASQTQVTGSTSPEPKVKSGQVLRKVGTGKVGGETPTFAQTSASPDHSDENIWSIQEQLTSEKKLVPRITEKRPVMTILMTSTWREKNQTALSDARPSLLVFENCTDPVQVDSSDMASYSIPLSEYALLKSIIFNKKSHLMCEKSYMRICQRTIFLDKYHLRPTAVDCLSCKCNAVLRHTRTRVC